MWKINTTVKKIFTYITATCIYNHINRKNLYDRPQNRPFIVQLKKHFTYKWCCESNSEHQIFRWFWDLSEYRPLHYRISLATVSELCPLYVERSVRNPGHLFRQGCPSWYVWQCFFVDIFGCRIEYGLHNITVTHLSGFCLCHTCPGVYTCALLHLFQVFEGTQGMFFVGCLDTNHPHILLPYL